MVRLWATEYEKLPGERIDSASTVFKTGVLKEGNRSWEIISLKLPFYLTIGFCRARQKKRVGDG